MRIFVSHSHKDQEAVDRIVSRLVEDGHDVWVDRIKLVPGDNIQREILHALKEADALVVVISENSFRSAWVQQEVSTIALQEISNPAQRIIPVRIDESEVPSYLADRLYLDLSHDFERGLERLSQALSGHKAASIPKPTEGTLDAAESQIQKLSDALRKGRLCLVCGAGVSVAAGIPDWGPLLIRLLETMMRRISKDRNLDVGKKAASKFQERYGASSLILGKYLKNNLGRDFQIEMRDALYSSNPATSPLIDSIVALSRPQRDGRPLDSILTFNFDCLIEENLSANSISNKPIFSEAIMHASNELPIYHVHGYLPRTGEIPADTELVFAEDAYHSQFIDPFSWSNLIQLNKLTQNTCLFVGISLTDPNMRRLLDVAWRKNPDKTRSHYIVKKLPRFSDANVLDDVSKLLEEQDANALGLNVIWINDFPDLPKVLRGIGEADGS